MLLEYFVAQLTHLYEETCDRCMQAQDQATLACHLLSSYGVGHDDLRQFSPKLNTSSIRRLRETKILTTCMFDLEGERTDISIKEIEAIKNKKIKKTYMKSAVKLLLDAQLRLREVAERAGVSLHWAASSVLRWGNPISKVQRQLERIARLRQEKQLYNPTGFFIESMEQSQEVLLSEFNDPDLHHDRSPLHNLRFLAEGQTLLRKLSALRKDFPEEFQVSRIIVSEDGEVLGARSTEGMELTLTELKRDYGLISKQEEPLDLPESCTLLPGLSSEARQALLKKVQAGKALDSLDQKCLQGTGWTGGFLETDRKGIINHLLNLTSPVEPRVQQESLPKKPLPVQPLTPQQRDGIIQKLQKGTPLSTSDTIFLTLAGHKHHKTLTGNRELLERLQAEQNVQPKACPLPVQGVEPGELLLGW